MKSKEISNLSNISQIEFAEIESVLPNSIGKEVGFEKGDKIISINGIKLRDVIDYKFLIAEQDLKIEVLGNEGGIHQLIIEKEEDDDLGLIFTNALFDGLNQCNNRCPFCFIDQQPPGKRNSLYIKDDDYRMSFLYGSYLTLTNLGKEDWNRIDEQRLSPLFISIHATDPSLRSKMLKNPRAGLLMQQLDWFAQRKLQVHAQVVICPGLNDGIALDKTLRDLAKYGLGEWPTILSTAVVPVGLTKFRPINDGLVPVNEACATKIIHQVEAFQTEFKKILGSRFVWLSDEWYLIAGMELPSRKQYENMPQQENGVGSIRAFLESMQQATTSLPQKTRNPKTVSWVVGKIVEKALKPSCARLNMIKGATVFLYGLSSPYWGQEKVVTGLLTGQDILEGLKNKPLGNELLLPSVMLKEGEPIFLDDMSIEQLSNHLGLPISVVHGADDIVAAVLGDPQKIN